MKKISLHKQYLVLGANGFLGNRLYARLKMAGMNVRGTSRRKGRTRMLFLDTARTSSIERFPWNDFDVIIDCVGSIDYRNNTEAIQKNILTNVLGPLEVIKRLSKKHRYFYLSTHAVLLSPEKHNPYSFSKFYFEQSFLNADDIVANVTFVRIPAVFSEERKNGLLHLIKKCFYDKNEITRDFILHKWHTMHEQRAIEILAALVLSGKQFKKINIGYPAEFTIERTLSCAEGVFGGRYVVIGRNQTDHYVPDLSEQNQLCKITSEDMDKDLKLFFCE